MSRSALDLLTRALEAAYRGDRWHALRRNLGTVQPREWHVRPADHSVDVFGTDPELSIADLVQHVATAKFMYANHAFGDASLAWDSVKPPSRAMEAMLTWLDDGHTLFTSGFVQRDDDSELALLRRAHWGEPVPTEQIVSAVINHDLYHSGEINRQLSLLRGSSGWTR